MNDAEMDRFSTYELIAETCARLDERIGLKLDDLLTNLAEEGYPLDVALQLLATHVDERISNCTVESKISPHLQIFLPKGTNGPKRRNRR